MTSRISNSAAFAVAAVVATCLIATTARAQTGVPAFNVVAPNGQTNILIGTMHVAYDGLRQPDPNIMKSAKVLVVEHAVDFDAVDSVMDEESKKGFQSGQLIRARWAQGLTAAQAERLRTSFNCISLTPLDAATFNMLFLMKSPRVMAQLAFVPCATPGALSRDAILNRSAEKFGVPTLPLETQAEIKIRRLAITEQMHEEDLQAGLRMDLVQLYDNLVRAFNAGDFDAVARIAKPSYRSSSDVQRFNRVMVAERNHAWMPVLKPTLDAGGAVVAVGAAHLPGKDGLIALLKTAGYQVRPKTLPEGK